MKQTFQSFLLILTLVTFTPSPVKASTSYTESSSQDGFITTISELITTGDWITTLWNYITGTRYNRVTTYESETCYGDILRVYNTIDGNVEEVGRHYYYATGQECVEMGFGVYEGEVNNRQYGAWVYSGRVKNISSHETEGGEYTVKCNRKATCERPNDVSCP